MVKRRLMLESFDPSEVVGALGLPVPVTALPVEIDNDRRVFVFALDASARDTVTTEQLKNIAQTLGNLVHPEQSVFVVVPRGSKLTAWEVTG